MIQPGIQEPIRITGATINDKGTLVLVLTDGDDGNGSLKDAFESTSSNTSESDSDFYIWAPKEDERLKTEQEKHDNAINKIKALRGHLTHILEQFMPNASIKWNIMGPLQMNDVDLSAKLLDPSHRQPLMDAIYKLYTEQFVKMLTPFLSTRLALRGKFVRQSKEKHFPKFPGFAPFLEPASIPRTQSKLKFTPFELGKQKGDPDKGPFTGVNWADPTPVPGAGNSTKAGDPQQAADVAKLFGQ